MYCFYHPEYYLALPPGHPFPMDKFPRAKGVLSRDEEFLIREAPLASWDEINKVHTGEYLHAVENGTLTASAQSRLGLPHHPRLLERSRREVGGTLAATRHVMENGGFAANLAGGTHHAFPDHGEGYCVLNDVAIAIHDVLKHAPDSRILVIDTDAHQGNGTNAIFQEDDRVTTYSIHVGRNYPSRKVPGDYDVSLERNVTETEYTEQLHATLPKAINAVEPDLIFWITGADCHERDRFGQMALSTQDMAERDAYVALWCREISAPTVVLYGGGYNINPLVTAMLHCQSIRVCRNIQAHRIGH